MASTSAVLLLAGAVYRLSVTSEAPALSPPFCRQRRSASGPLVGPIQLRSHGDWHLPMAFAIGTRRSCDTVACRAMSLPGSGRDCRAKFRRSFSNWPGHRPSIAVTTGQISGRVRSADARYGCIFVCVASAIGDGDRPVTGRRRPSRRPGPAADANPTVRQRELGIRLRELRNGLGLTVEQVGAELLCSATKISRLETGARRASLRDVRDLCEVYGVPDSTQAQLMELARQARERGWWSRYDDLRLEPYIGLEQEAVAITSYTMYYIPSLLQSGDYARAVIRGIGRKIDSRVLGDRVEARLLRQKRLEVANPPRYRALADEAVFHRPVGGTAVMKAQLDKILTWAAFDRGSIQVIPFSAGAHASADSNFDLLEFGDNTRQDAVVYVETLLGALYHERANEVARYREAIEYLRDAALSTQDSLALIAQIRDTF